MRKHLHVLFVFALIAMPFVARAEVKVEETDVRENKSGERFVMFVSKPTDAAGRTGHALVGMGKGASLADAKIETAFGLQVKDNKPATGMASAEDIENLRKLEGQHPTLILFVRVDDEQYAAAQETLKKYSTPEELAKDPNTALLNFLMALQPKLGLKAPYVSGLSGPAPMTYFSDLQRLNRAKR